MRYPTCYQMQYQVQPDIWPAEVRISPICPEILPAIYYPAGYLARGSIYFGQVSGIQQDIKFIIRPLPGIRLDIRTIKYRLFRLAMWPDIQLFFIYLVHPFIYSLKVIVNYSTSRGV